MVIIIVTYSRGAQSDSVLVRALGFGFVLGLVLLLLWLCREFLWVGGLVCVGLLCVGLES